MPTLRLKLFATTLSGALMGMAGAPLPYYIGYLQPSSAFGLDGLRTDAPVVRDGGRWRWRSRPLTKAQRHPGGSRAPTRP